MNAAPDFKYDFLLALQLGEKYEFDISPTPTESRRHLPPSARKAYYRVQSGICTLHRRHPSFGFRLRVKPDDDTKLEVMLVKAGDRMSSEHDWRSLERKKIQSLESWKKRKTEEGVRELPRQLAEETAKSIARRTAGAIRAQFAQVPKIDPAKLAWLVAQHCRGAAIEHQTENGEWVADASPSWTLATDRYRVKPVIRDFYLVIGRDGRVTAGATSVEALPHHDPACRVHVREVPPE